jgi:hypothetical protein
LVFLSGAAAIRETAEAIAALAAEHDVDVAVLHGDLPLDEQRRAIQQGPRRKIVLSTNGAETALTIEGVTTVIDSGLAREARFDARHGVNRLEEVRISRAAPEQRASRAGRTGPGRCVGSGPPPSTPRARTGGFPRPCSSISPRSLSSFALGAFASLETFPGSIRRAQPRSRAPTVCSACSARSIATAT